MPQNNKYETSYPYMESQIIEYHQLSNEKWKLTMILMK